MKRRWELFAGAPLASLLSCGWIADLPGDPRFTDERNATGGAAAGGSGGAPRAGSSTGGAGARAGAPVDAGASGGGPADGPTLGAPCEDPGARACTSANANLVLVCDPASETWKEDLVCRADQRCSFELGDEGCTDLHGSCTSSFETGCTSHSWVSGCLEDPLRPVERYCPFGCRDGACLAGVGDQLVVHSEYRRNSFVSWQGDVPVCFASEPGNETLEGWIRSEVTRTWGRFLNVNFVGWERCPSGAAGVVVEFLDACRERLGQNVHVGSPGEGAESRVGICRSFYDAAGVTLEDMSSPENEALARFVARHQFGHVVGLDDQNFGTSGTVMVRGLEKHRAGEIVVTDEDASFFSFSYYGQRPPGSLVTGAGLCLELTDAGQVAPRTCAGSDAQRWLVARGSVESLDGDDGSCVALSAAEEVEIGPCAAPAPARSLSLARVQWRTAELCVVPRSLPAVSGSALTTRRCAAPGDPRAAWSVEVQSARVGELFVKIRVSGSSLCVTAPRVRAEVNDAPLLEDCNATERRQLFRLWSNGAVAFDDSATDDVGALYVNPASPGGVLWFGLGSIRVWFVSGAVESPGGVALSVAPDDPSAELGAAPLLPGGVPGPDQIFDFHF